MNISWMVVMKYIVFRGNQGLHTQVWETVIQLIWPKYEKTLKFVTSSDFSEKFKEPRNIDFVIY